MCKYYRRCIHKPVVVRKGVIFSLGQIYAFNFILPNGKLSVVLIIQVTEFKLCLQKIHYGGWVLKKTIIPSLNI